MTDAQLRDQAVAHLQLTTVGRINSKWKTPPAGTHWAFAEALLAQISSANSGIVAVAVAALNQTTVGYVNKSWKPPPPHGTHWQVGLDALATIAADSNAPAPPVGPFTKFTGGQVYRDIANPSEIKGLQIDGGQSTAQASNGLVIQGYFGGPTEPPAPSPSAFDVHDIIATDIGTIPYVDDGTAEAGIWFGTQVNAKRLIADGSCMGLWVGAQSADSVISDFTVGKADEAGGYTKPVPWVGVYIEHFTRRTTFERFDIHSTGHGFRAEQWWFADGTWDSYVAKEYPQAPAGSGGSCEITFQDGRIYCPPGSVGLFLDAGTWGCTIQGIEFWGPGDAIWTPKNLAVNEPNVIDLASCKFGQSGQDVYYHNNTIKAA